MDYSSTSKSALKWAANNLLRHGDHLILIHVEPPNSDTPTKLLFQHTGSRTHFSFLSLKFPSFTCLFYNEPFVSVFSILQLWFLLRNLERLSWRSSMDWVMMQRFLIFLTNWLRLKGYFVSLFSLSLFVYVILFDEWWVWEWNR